jgi:beta-galactosidase
MLSDAIQEKIILSELEKCNIKTPDQDIRWPLITKSGINDENKLIHYYYNYSSESGEFSYPYQEGKELISGEKVSQGQMLQIAPWDVLIIEETANRKIR